MPPRHVYESTGDSISAWNHHRVRLMQQQSSHIQLPSVSLPESGLAGWAFCSPGRDYKLYAEAAIGDNSDGGAATAPATFPAPHARAERPRHIVSGCADDTRSTQFYGKPAEYSDGVVLCERRLPDLGQRWPPSPLVPHRRRQRQINFS